MSVVSLTLTYTGTINKALFDYLKTIEETYKDNRELVKEIDTIKGIALINSTREYSSKYPL